MAIYYKLVRNNNKSNRASYQKYYAHLLSKGSVDLEELAKHMANHNSPYSKGAIMGVLQDMVACIKELLQDGNKVKIADLGIFYLNIVNACGCANQDDYRQSEYISGVRLRCLPSGETSKAILNQDTELVWDKRNKELVQSAYKKEEEDNLDLDV